MGVRFLNKYCTSYCFAYVIHFVFNWKTLQLSSYQVAAEFPVCCTGGIEEGCLSFTFIVPRNKIDLDCW